MACSCVRSRRWPRRSARRCATSGSPRTVRSGYKRETPGIRARSVRTGCPGIAHAARPPADRLCSILIFEYKCSRNENMKPLIHHVLGETRTAVLAALLMPPEASLHLRELARTTGASPGALHRELGALVGYGVLLREEAGRQVFYRPNPD